MAEDDRIVWTALSRNNVGYHYRCGAQWRFRSRLSDRRDRVPRASENRSGPQCPARARTAEPSFDEHRYFYLFFAAGGADHRHRRPPCIWDLLVSLALLGRFQRDRTDHLA